MTIAFTPDLRDILDERCAAFPRVVETDQRLKRAAVVIVLTDADDGSGEATFLLTRRSSRLRAHSGQWALPGGRCDAGETLIQTALRELDEELGLRLPPTQVLGVLDDYATRSGYAMTPVIAWLDGPAALTPNPAEVASVHRIRLAEITRPDAVSFKLISESPRKVIRLQMGEHHIHAPTAAVIYQFRELLAGRVTRIDDLEQPVFAWR